jgi:hypothetical protein
MTTAHNWKSLFIEWPAEFPKGGIIVTTLNETVPFRKFWLKGEMLLLERTVPDATGGRFLLLGYDVISCVKFTNPLSEAAIDGAGFAAAGDAGLLHTV